MPEKDLSPQEMMEQSYQQAKTSYVIRERRYHLLQAAATIMAGSFFHIEGGAKQFWENHETAVDLAEALLAEIEKRENAEKQS